MIYNKGRIFLSRLYTIIFYYVEVRLIRYYFKIQDGYVDVTCIMTR